MQYGRLVRVTPPSTSGNAEPYVVAAEDPNAAMKLVADKIAIARIWK
jgi:hypothetical protein